MEEKHPPQRPSPMKRPRYKSRSPPKAIKSPKKRVPPRRTLPLHASAKPNLQSPSRRPNGENLGSLITDFKEFICTGHVNCAPLSKTITRSLLGEVSKTGEILLRQVPANEKLRWMDGILEIDEALKDDLWTKGECKFCFIEDLVLSDARFPWLTGLKYSKQNVAYERSLECLRSLGEETELYEIWVNSVLGDGIYV
jgi:hypothetical protein